MHVARQRGAIWIAPLCSSDPCPIAVMAFPAWVVGVRPPLPRTSLFMGPSQTTHSSILAAKGQTSPARTCHGTSRGSQWCPCKHLAPTPPLPVAPGPNSAPLLNSLHPIHLTQVVYYFLYYVEEFLEPQDPGGFYGNNKFRQGARTPPAAPPPAPALECLISSCSFLWLAAEPCGLPQSGLGGYLLWISAILHIHGRPVAVVQQRRAELGCVPGWVEAPFFFFFLACVGFYLFCKCSGPYTSQTYAEFMKACWHWAAAGFCLFFFFPLIWMFSSWPVHWPERGREDSCIPQGTRIFREAGTAFSFSQQVAPWFLQSTSWKPWNTVSFWTKCATSAPFLPESGLGGCNLETYTKRGALTWDPAQKYGMAQAGATFWGSLKGHLISGLKLPSSAPDSLQPGLLWGHPSLSSCGPGSTCQQPEGRVNRGLINPEIWNF